MRIRELLATGRPSFSFEFFPPKTQEGSHLLLEAIDALKDLRPTYVSVTYGAGGSTRDLTIDLVRRIQQDFGIETMAHLTCVGSNRDEIRDVVNRLADSGIQNVLALRGDPPKGQTAFSAVEGGFHHASELTGFLRQHWGLCVGGACYPEGHTEAVSLDADIANLRHKVEAGAEFLVTQLFFDNQKYFDFVRRVRDAGIGVPIIPGLMPITNVEQVERFTRMCGASIPEPLLSELQRLRDRPDAVLSLGVAHATAQCLDLLAKGAHGIHFYTLNKSAATRTILTALRTVYPAAR
ncbi:MAG: methylenetetrahydrofolate reductase [NAD(P)H] [Bryobacterales bacterium]|jgi:methylenetetrahydrofolate reductase (NADPH)|nr:methylenetetrahydrofolate reductase [NAD(P)H] [Bryobacterales bacterium]